MTINANQVLTNLLDLTMVLSSPEVSAVVEVSFRFGAPLDIVWESQL